jgi:hypothetical protein
MADVPGHVHPHGVMITTRLAFVPTAVLAEDDPAP